MCMNPESTYLKARDLILISCILLVCYMSGFAQNNPCLSINDSLDFFFGYESPHDTIDINGKWTVLGETKLVVVVRLGNEEKECLSHLERKQVLHLLRNRSTSYEMNLILYDHFDLDAGYLGQLSVEDWRKRQMVADIKYWKRVLGRRPMQY